MSDIGSSSSFLRRTVKSLDESQTGRVTDIFSRLLDEDNSGDSENTNSRGSGTDDGKAFMLFAGIVVCFVGICSMYCMYQTIRFWCCRRFHAESTAVLVTDGFAFNLNSRQRRDVLEAIFSDTSKAVTKTMFFSKKSSSKDLAGGDGKEESIPNNYTSGTLDKTDADSVDLEANTNDAFDSSLSPSAFDLPIDEEERDPEGLQRGLGLGCACISMPEDKTLSAGSETDISNQESFVVSNVRRSFPWQVAKSGQKKTTKDLALPSLGEECKEEEGEPEIKMAPSLPIVASSDEAEADQDDDDDENVCAICLSGYKEGELVISSKYCNHLFHKDCILEWLEKKDDCPCCRVEMVTSGDVNKATASIVGKTRMCRAVESIRVRTPPTSPTPRGPRGISPRVRRVSSSR